MKLKPGWTEDETGLWYRTPGRGNRSRGRWAVCEVCSERFPSLLGNPGKYCSKRCLGRAKGGAMRQGRSDLFKSWTPAECWLAGLLWADGHLAARQGNSRSVMLNLTDEEIIAAAADVIGCRYRTYEQRPSVHARKPLHRLTFGHPAPVGRLASIGFDQPKLTTRPWPELPHPASFLRGMFDGDGCVAWQQQGGRHKTPTTPWRLHSHLCGSMPCIEGFQGFLQESGISPKKPVRNGAIHRIGWNHKDSLRLADVMYSEPGPFLSIKKNLFLGRG